MERFFLAAFFDAGFIAESSQTPAGFGLTTQAPLSLENSLSDSVTAKIFPLDGAIGATMECAESRLDAESHLDERAVMDLIQRGAVDEAEAAVMSALAGGGEQVTGAPYHLWSLVCQCRPGARQERAALQHLRSAVRLADPGSADEGRLLRELAELLLDRGEDEEALAALEQALPALRRPDSGHGPLDVARTLVETAKLALDLECAARAVAYLEEARAIFEKHRGAARHELSECKQWLADAKMEQQEQKILSKMCVMCGSMKRSKMQPCPGCAAPLCSSRECTTEHMQDCREARRHYELQEQRRAQERAEEAERREKRALKKRAKAAKKEAKLREELEKQRQAAAEQAATVEKKQCVDCAAHLPKKDFSAKQWKSGHVCRSCQDAREQKRLEEERVKAEAARKEKQQANQERVAQLEREKREREEKLQRMIEEELRKKRENEERAREQARIDKARRNAEKKRLAEEKRLAREAEEARLLAEEEQRKEQERRAFEEEKARLQQARKELEKKKKQEQQKPAASWTIKPAITPKSAQDVQKVVENQAKILAILEDLKLGQYYEAIVDDLNCSSLKDFCNLTTDQLQELDGMKKFHLKKLVEAQKQLEAVPGKK